MIREKKTLGIRLISGLKTAHFEGRRDENAPWPVDTSNDAEIFSANRLIIIESALTIESILASIITAYFYPELGEKRTDFEEMIVHTNWCSFAEKKRLVLALGKRRNLLNKVEIKKLNDNLAEVMTWRNAFTHGSHRFILGGDLAGTIALHYFKDGHKETTITEKLLSDIEKLLQETSILNPVRSTFGRIFRPFKET